MKYTAAFAVWVILLSYGLLKPGDPNDPAYFLFPEDDKLIHLGLFAGATTLWLLSMRLDWQIDRLKSILIAGIGSVVAAASTELIQFSVPYRSPDIYDFLSNALGVILVIGVYLRISRKEVETG